MGATALESLELAGDVKGSYARFRVVLFATGMAGTVTNVSVTFVTSSLARSWDVPLSESRWQ